MILIVLLGGALIALGFWCAKCPACGFYRDPEHEGCNCT